MKRPRRLTWRELTLALTLTFAAIVLAFSPTPGRSEPASKITVTGVWVRPTIGPMHMSAGYLTLHNSGDTDVVLTGARSDKAGSVGLHETVHDGDIVKMRAIKGGLKIPAGGEVSLAPGGRHLMIMDLKGSLKAGDTLPLTLTFRNGDTMSIDAPVTKGNGGDQSGN